jgi:hypothetical protein
LYIRLGRSSTATKVDVEMVEAVMRDENKVGMTLLRSGTMSARDVPQLKT